MKTNFIFLFLILFGNVVFAQYKNIDKLPQKERDSILVKIANEAIDKYSIGYLRPGNKPIIEDLGLITQREVRHMGPYVSEYLNRYHYAVSYAPTKKEQEYYKSPYLVRAIILADVGKVFEIRYIDDGNRVQSRLEKVSRRDESKIIKREFITVERSKESVKTIRCTIPSPEMQERIRLKLERHYRQRDSAIARHLNAVKKRDSIWKQDSIRLVRQRDSIRNVQGKNK